MYLIKSIGISIMQQIKNNIIKIEPDIGNNKVNIIRIYMLYEQYKSVLCIISDNKFEK